MKKKRINPQAIAAGIGEYFRRTPERRSQAVTVVISYIFLLAILALFSQFSIIYARFNVSRFEPGRVADEDLVADREYTFVDDVATRTRADARLKLVLPVFMVNDDVSKSVQGEFRDFHDFFVRDSIREQSAEKLYLRFQTERPGTFSREDVRYIYDFPSRELLYAQTANLLDQVLARGVVAFPKEGLEHYNTEYIEIWRWQGNHQEREEIPVTSVMTLSNYDRILLADIAGMKVSKSAVRAALGLLHAFVRENTFFNADQSAKELDQALRGVDPVVRRIAKGERIIKKGFIVTDADIQKVKAIGASSMTATTRPIFSVALSLLLFYILAFILLNRSVIGTTVTPRLFYFFLGLAAGYVTLSAILFRFVELPPSINLGLLLPTALVAMVVTLTVNVRASIIFSLVISVSTLIVTDLDVTCFLFSFFSGVAGTVVVKDVEKRIDLIRAGTILAGINAGMIVVLDLPRSYDALELLSAAFWAAFNGFFCGIFTIGFLPMFEQVLNAPTRFRLIELSDLNSPLLKRLLTVAPGTYGHSVMVANLAESACRDIGANALLARVGAYYHDIGKMDSPEYFIENQTTYNKHDELKPRLSATVIRSHVKIGVEKARQLRLPDAVIDIIAQHHGNGVITWFYNRAMQDEEGQVMTDDFSYNGTPPKSREAAVVMLADTVEAATRTLKKPTLVKLEKFIDELFMDKFNSGQLNESELTFRDLEIIKRTFVQILAGHFHSRIEYPKAKETSP